MTQKELIKKLSIETGFAQKDIKVVLDAMPDILIQAIQAEKVGGVVEVPGVVRLKVVQNKARKQRVQFNSMLKKDVVVPAKPAERTVRPLLALTFKKAVTHDVGR